MKVTINQKGTERLLKGHAWIFRSDVTSVEKEQAGTAAVYSHQGKLLGEALYSPKSLIALRLMTRGPEKITQSTIRERLAMALARRREMYPQDEAYRLAFGEADHLPSLIVDRFGDSVVFQTLSAGMETFKDHIVLCLRELLGPRSIFERNDSSVRQHEDLPLIRQAVYGEAREEIDFRFSGKTFAFQPLEGQKTGFFLDQRFNGEAASRYAKGEMLDAFCYVGQFGLHAAPRVASVLCVDASEPALAQVQRNVQANGFENIQTRGANVFDFLKECDLEQRRFDTISLDPPAFVKNKASLKQAWRGYKEINLRAMRLLRPGGILITSSCSQHMNVELFERMLSEAARDARRPIQLLEKRGQPADHPILLSMPETEYLKCYILRVE
ncbi:MAG: class I SAM-dependent rRNA methyltransferase [Deltaproteobacteria bacterium]|nr:class I SAM-dependent rRNA methyltransferase [Deltaproteobacteria bacterium]